MILSFQLDDLLCAKNGENIRFVVISRRSGSVGEGMILSESRMH